MLYKAVRKGLISKPSNFIKHDESFQAENGDWYTSLYYYNDTHLQIFKDKDSLKGIENTVTNTIFFDFDSKNDLNLAKKETVELCHQLVDVHKISIDSILCHFSGYKGFAVQFTLDQFITPLEFVRTVYGMASSFSTFDKRIHDPNRIIRVSNTKHPETGLYKVPLELWELEELSIEEIKNIAKTPRIFNIKKPTSNFKVKKLMTVVTKPKEPEEFKIEDIDFSLKIKGWSNCKWALLNGYTIKQQDRHSKLLCIISHSKSLNNTKEQAYYNAKMADEYGTRIYGGEKSSKNDLWTMVESVYSDGWKGGTHSCKNDKTPWLTEICQSLGIYKCKHEEVETLIDVNTVFDSFVTYAKEIDKNTIKTGIVSLDEKVRFRSGQMIGILGAPSSGKTAMALEMLENTSKNGLLSIFYSLDMSKSELFQKIAQRVTGYDEDYLFKVFQTNPIESDRISQLVFKCYSNVKFCFDTGVSVESITNTIDEWEATNNNKVSLLLLDYNELLSSPYSDMTASSGYNAGALKKLTNSRDICTISLLQPPKMVGDASCEINSYRSIKGSSLLEQCFSIVLGIYRPGFNAQNNSEDDNFLVMNVLKNRLGKLSSLSYYWDGLTGKISRIDEAGVFKLKQIREKKNIESMKKEGW